MITNKPRSLLGWIGNYALWIVMSAMTLLPVYWMFAVSARSRVQLFSRPSFIINSFYIQNYIEPLTNPTFQRYSFALETAGLG